MSIPEFIFKNTAPYDDCIALAVKYHKTYIPITYRELKRRTHACAQHLISLGVKPHDRVGIFSENRPEWVIADLAIQSIGAITVPIHSVFRPKYVQHCIEDSGIKVLFLSDNHLFEKIHETHKEYPLEKIIYFSRNKIFGIDHEKYIFFHDLLKERRQGNQEVNTHTPISSDDIATIVYTSGTTGLPKGVMLTHKNIITNIAAVLKAIPIRQQDTFLSILPLSHIFERTGGYYAPLTAGSSIYYASQYKNISSDLITVKPTIILAVPRVFEKAKEKILQKKIVRIVQKLPGGSTIVGLVVRKRFGGRIRFCVSGGATLDQNVGSFFGSFGIPILEGYGLTETSPVISCNRIHKNKYGSCGLPLDNIEVALTADNELLVKGPSIMKGYYNLPDKTREVFTDDGFLKTGDFARLDSDGFIYITGRKKNIIVLSTGKNVQPEMIESHLTQNPYIGHIVVIGDNRKMVTALIVPEFDYCASRGITDEKTMHHIIQQEIHALLVDFPEHEHIKKFTLLQKPFTIEDDELTPTLKVKRKIIEERYKNEIDEMYR